MTKRTITVGHSPDPDDAFMFYALAHDKIDTGERVLVQRGNKKGGLISLGFEDVFNFDGCEVSYEYGIPTNNGYGFAMEHMELRSLQGQVFVPEGPDFDIASQSYRFSIDFFGNLRINPRYQTKWTNVT